MAMILWRMFITKTLINKVPLLKYLLNSVTIQNVKLYPSIPESKQIKNLMKHSHLLQDNEHRRL